MGMVETMLSTDISVTDAAAVLQRFELIDSVESVVLALEARLSGQAAIDGSLVTLRKLHRGVIASAANALRCCSGKGVNVLRDCDSRES